MSRPPKEEVKLLRVEKKTIRFKNKDGQWTEQEVEVKVYEPKKTTEDVSLAEEILGSDYYEPSIEDEF